MAQVLLDEGLGELVEGPEELPFVAQPAEPTQLGLKEEQLVP